MSRVRRIVTSRCGGHSAGPYESFNLATHVGDDPAAVTANRRRLSRATGLGTDRLVWMDQVHGADVTEEDGPRAEPVPATDALVTATPGLVLAVLVADCVPVLLADPTAAVVAAVHAGRTGAAAGVVLRAEVEPRLPGSASTTRRGTPGLDVRAGIARQLAALGVGRVVVDPRCTAEDPELFSHRRDGVTGRQAGVVWIEA